MYVWIVTCPLQTACAQVPWLICPHGSCSHRGMRLTPGDCHRFALAHGGLQPIGGQTLDECELAGNLAPSRGLRLKCNAHWLAQHNGTSQALPKLLKSVRTMVVVLSAQHHPLCCPQRRIRVVDPAMLAGLSKPSLDKCHALTKRRCDSSRMLDVHLAFYEVCRLLTFRAEVTLYNLPHCQGVYERPMSNDSVAAPLGFGKLNDHSEFCDPSQGRLLRPCIVGPQGMRPCLELQYIRGAVDLANVSVVVEVCLTLKLKLTNYPFFFTHPQPKRMLAALTPLVMAYGNPPFPPGPALQPVSINSVWGMLTCSVSISLRTR